MIGTPSFILESLAALVPLAAFLFTIYWLLSKRQITGFAFVTFSGLMLFLMGTRYYYQLSNHLFLSRLSANDVARIQIWGSEITKASDIDRIVAALNEREWFSPNHGGWGEEVGMEIKMKEGWVKRYAAGYYRRQPGAIIRFYRGSWSDGYAFSERLPEILKQVGAKLPSQNRTTPNKGMHQSTRSEFDVARQSPRTPSDTAR